MKTSTIIWIIIIVIIILGGWYWYSMSAAQPTPDQNSTSTPSAQAGINGSPDQGNLGGASTGTPQQPASAIANVASDAELGQYLTASNGMTLYTYAKDTKGVSNCTGACAAAWPPYAVSAPSDINAPATVTGTFGTLTRPDGTLQVTYNGMPLYFWKSDVNPGDTTGQGVGGVWFVVKP